MNISTSELLSYSSILENIITSNIGLMKEMDSGVESGFTTKEELQPLFDKCNAAKTEADLKYYEIQKELDMRIKRDLKMKLGITSSQKLIREFDDFVRQTNQKMFDEQRLKNEQLKKIAEDVNDGGQENKLKVVDDNPEE